LVILIFLGVAGYFFWRDRRYLKKNIRDVAPDELKKFLNLPHPDAKFQQHLPSEAPKPRASRRILDGMNDPNE
jgi:hypothetical protein